MATTAELASIYDGIQSPAGVPVTYRGWESQLRARTDLTARYCTCAGPAHPSSGLLELRGADGQRVARCVDFADVTRRTT